MSPTIVRRTQITILYIDRFRKIDFENFSVILLNQQPYLLGSLFDQIFVLIRQGEDRIGRRFDRLDMPVVQKKGGPIQSVQ